MTAAMREPQPIDGLEALVNAIETTASTRTARLAVSSRLGSPVPTPEGLRGEGIADFSLRRARFDDRLVTPRMAAQGPDARERKGLSRRFLEGLTGQDEVFIDGGNVYKRLSDVGWIDEGLDPNGPRPLIDPLWLFDGLMGAERAEAGEPESLNGGRAERYRLDLRRAIAEDRVGRPMSWPEEADRRGFFRRGRSMPAERVPAEVWVDEDGRIRRLSFVPVVTTSPDRALWAITDLSDFGVAADLSTLPVPSPDRA